MDITLETNVAKSKPSLFNFLIICTGVLLNQTQVIFNFNVSFSDFFALGVFFVLIISGKLEIPFVPMLFFIVVSLTILVTSSVLMPLTYSYYPDLRTIFQEYIKFFALFIYFVLGFNTLKNHSSELLLKSFSMASFCVAVLGLLALVGKVGFLMNGLFLDGQRLQGLMSDANFFSVLQVTAFVYFSRTKRMNKYLKSIAILMIILSILISGSKTGTITFILYLFTRWIRNVFTKKKKVSTILVHLLGSTILIMCAAVVFSRLNQIITFIDGVIPGAQRLLELFTNFRSAVSQNGSIRTDVWQGGLQLIKASPLVGVGLGFTSQRVTPLFGNMMDPIAHNTYLQYCIDWGIPLALIFIGYVFTLLLVPVFQRNRFKNNHEVSESIKMISDMILVLLIGSFGISLNNSRLFYVLLGLLLYLIKTQKGSRRFQLSNKD